MSVRGTGQPTKESGEAVAVKVLTIRENIVTVLQTPLSINAFLWNHNNVVDVFNKHCARKVIFSNKTFAYLHTNENSARTFAAVRDGGDAISSFHKNYE